MITVTPAATEGERDAQIIELLMMIYNLLVSGAPGPTCNPEAVWWPPEVIVPDGWGTPCPWMWLDLPMTVKI